MRLRGRTLLQDALAVVAHQTVTGAHPGGVFHLDHPRPSLDADGSGKGVRHEPDHDYTAGLAFGLPSPPHGAFRARFA